MNVNEQHAVVKNSLSQFMKRNIPGANLKKVDQIVLEYVVSILEEASQDESFDVEGEFLISLIHFEISIFLISFSFSRDDVGIHQGL